MEEIEGTNRAAVESSHRVLSLLSRPPPTNQQDHSYDRALVSETREAMLRFKRVGNLLNHSVGHARFRRAKNHPQSPSHQRTELSSQLVLSGQSVQSGPSFHGLSLRPSDSLSLGTKSFSLMNSTPKPPQVMLSASYQQQKQLHERIQAHNLHLHHHHQQQQQQQQKQQGEMMLRKCNGGSSLSFDNNSSCTTTPTMSSTRSFISTLSIDGSSVNLDGKSNNSFHLVGVPSSSSQHSNKRKCAMKVDEHGSVKCGGSNSRCHCSKKRKHRVRRSIRVPAISNKVADIPPDDYSWRKYGQKPIKGSPYPRGYYKCSSMRGCPARKHVERCLEDPAMLIVTYEAEHNHPKLPAQTVTT